MIEAIIRWLRKNTWRHKWVYGDNPYRRRCSVCGQRQESVCWTLETWNQAWWEVWEQGDETRHYKEQS